MKRELSDVFHYLLSLVFPLLLLQSCASIISGTHQSVTIETSPPGAQITIFDTTITNHQTEDSSWSEIHASLPIIGASPMTASLARGVHHTIEVKKEGYKTVRYTTGNATAGWYWGNSFIWPLGGSLVDVETGAAYSIRPNRLDIPLTQGTGASETTTFQDSTSTIWIAPILSTLVLVVLAVPSFHALNAALHY